MGARRWEKPRPPCWQPRDPLSCLVVKSAVLNRESASVYPPSLAPWILPEAPKTHDWWVMAVWTSTQVCQLVACRSVVKHPAMWPGPKELILAWMGPPCTASSAELCQRPSQVCASSVAFCASQWLKALSSASAPCQLHVSPHPRQLGTRLKKTELCGHNSESDISV